MLKIKDIKLEQVFYAMDDNGEPHSFKATKEPHFSVGVWFILAKDLESREVIFNDIDERNLYLTDSMED